MIRPRHAGPLAEWIRTVFNPEPACNQQSEQGTRCIREESHAERMCVDADGNAWTAERRKER